MTLARIDQIRNHVAEIDQHAAGILEGDNDNYDGADGARQVSELCSIIDELLNELEA